MFVNTSPSIVLLFFVTYKSAFGRPTASPTSHISSRTILEKSTHTKSISIYHTFPGNSNRNLYDDNSAIQNVTLSTNHDNSPLLDKPAADLNEARTNRNLVGPIFGTLGLFIILVLYFLAMRKENRESKEKALQAKMKVEMKRKFMRDHMNVKIYTVESSSYIVDIEANRRNADESSTTSIDFSQEKNDDSAIIDKDNNSITRMQTENEVICPICHEQFVDDEKVASSQNDDCCHTIFHSDCIVSWLITDHKDCPICRSIFIVGEDYDHTKENDNEEQVSD